MWEAVRGGWSRDLPRSWAGCDPHRLAAEPSVFCGDAAGAGSARRWLQTRDRLPARLPAAGCLGGTIKRNRLHESGRGIRRAWLRPRQQLQARQLTGEIGSLRSTNMPLRASPEPVWKAGHMEPALEPKVRGGGTLGPPAAGSQMQTKDPSHPENTLPWGGSTFALSGSPSWGASSGPGVQT